MNGYSVEQAAEVLGIPQGRVWELIARGVLAGASEGGESMRVYLRGTAPTTVTASPEGEDRSNGNGHNGNGHGELSPFRELLTEFRNLTERYGQALLALGEARGEVASLRGRVELLEARMDMRLPMRARPSAAWEMPDLPQQRAAQPEVAAPAPSGSERARAWSGESDAAVMAQQPGEPWEPVEEAAAAVGGASEADADIEAASEADGAFDGEGTLEADAETLEAETETFETAAALQPDAAMDAATDEQQPAPAVDAVLSSSEGRRGRGDSRAAIAGLAAALARAEDPVLASLPGAREAGEALAALQQEMDTATVEEAEAPSPPEEVAEPEGIPSGEREGGEEAAEVPVLSGIEELSAVAPAIELAEEELGEESLVEEQIETQVAEDLVGEWVAEEPIETHVAEDLVEEWAAEEPIETHVAEDLVEMPEVTEPRAEPADVLAATDAGLEPTPAPPGRDSGALPAEHREESPYTTDVVEPDWFADGDFTWLETPEPEPEAASEPAAAEQEASFYGAELIEEEVGLATAGEPVSEAAVLSVEPESVVLEEPGVSAEQLPAAIEEPPTAAGEPEALPAEQEPMPLEETAEPEWVAANSEPMVTPPMEPEPTSGSGPGDEVDEGWPPRNHGGDEEGVASRPPAPEATAPDRPSVSVDGEVSERSQDAFVEPEPEGVADDSAPRTEAIHIEVEPDGAPDDDASWVTGERSRVAAASGVAGFGLFKGQPEAPPPAEPAARSLPERDEEALMWFGDELEAEALEIAAPGWHGEEAPGDEPVSPPAPAPRPPLQLSDAEIQQLASQEGWDVEEVQAIRGLLGRPAHARDPEPAAIAEATPPLPTRRGGDLDAEPDAAEDQQAAEPDHPGAEPPVPQRLVPQRLVPQRPTSPSPAPANRSQQPPGDWLRGRRGPAANAYRRLRRIFPG